MLHRRSIFLINKRFQLRFSFYVCSWLIALSFAYPLIISNLFDYFLRYLALDPMGPALANIEKTRQELLELLLVMQVIFLSLTFLISIFMSHKIAGPLYKLRRFFAEAKEGNYSQKLTFRKRDYFQELVPAYNAMMESVVRDIGMSKRGIQEAIPHLEKAFEGAEGESKAELKIALSILKESLNPSK